MDEDEKIDIMETNELPAAPAPLTWRDGAIPALALIMALVFWACFSFVRLLEYDMPHLGVLVLVAVHFVAVLITLGEKTKFTGGSIFCMAAALALAVSCAVWDEMSFTEANCLAILLLAAMATFGLSGHTACGAARAIPDAAALSFLAVFTKLDRPFRSLGRLGKKTNRKALGWAVLSVLVALPVAAVVLWLLSSADAVFGSLFKNLRFDLPAGAIWRPVRAVITALFIASALWYIREAPVREPAERPDRPRHVLPFLTVTAALDIVYIIFCFIQVKYLFGGAAEASMAGGWAAYARTGFFQLTAVAAIDLGLCLLGTDEKRFAARGGKALRAVYGLMLLCTAVILASAFRRMCLYIDAYGLSLLRLATLWAMAAMAAGVLAAAWKLIRPGFSFYRAAGTFAVVTWCVLCLAGPGRIVADYNVDRYLDGTSEEVDITYLRSLSADALPALERLAAAEPEIDEELADAIRSLQHSGDGAPWPQQSLSAQRTR